MPIQGTASDIVKIAMLKVDEALRAEGLKAQMIMQVHDELLVEAPEAEAERVDRDSQPRDGDAPSNSTSRSKSRSAPATTGWT